MRSKRSWAWAGLGASSLLAFLAACGSVSEDFKIIVVTPDAGQDAAPSEDATVADAATDAASDATSDATIPDGSVQDAQVDAGVDAGSGPVVPDGGSIVIVGDAAVVIPPLDPSLLGDGGLRLSDGGLANADGGALTPRQFRDLINGITCQRISECCCPGCSASEQAQTVSPTKCANGLGPNGLRLILTGNESIPSARVLNDSTKAAQCLALLNQALISCQSLRADAIASLRQVCLAVYTSTNGTNAPCTNAFDCSGSNRCAAADAGNSCQPLASEGATCAFSTDCTPRGVQGTPGRYCDYGDAAVASVPGTCQPYRNVGEVCERDTVCGAGACVLGVDGVKRCSAALPFGSPSDPGSFCVSFAP